MTRKLFPLAILALIAVPFHLTAELTYSIVPPNVTGGFSEVLNAIAIGDTNLVAVGNNSKVLTASIMTDGTIDLFNPAAWSPNSVPSAGFTLKAVTYGKGNFLASGKNNVVFSSSDTATWTSRGNALGAGSTVEAEGLAFGTNNFVLVPATVDVRYSASFSSPWPAATITSAAFLESYRAATTFGPGRFALCGIQGVVRISGNDGQSWSATRPFDFAETNLLGIATDGISTLVCVGDGGKIVVSADSGAHWTKVSYANAALNNKTLYAVTYAGTNGFVAVGDQGIVITSTDKGQTWARQTNYLVGQLSTLSLLGNGPQTNMYSQFATNELALSGRIMRGAFHTVSPTSHLRDLVVLVGDNGTVVLGGEIPDVPTNPVSQTNYAGFISTNLAVTVPPLITADWYWQGPGNSIVLVASNTATYAPPLIPNWQGYTEYTSNYFVYARDTRTGFVSTNSALVVLTTRPRPLATNNYAATVCNGSDSTLQVDLFGVAPNWKLVWSDTTNETVTSPNWTRTVFAAEITNRLDNCPTQYTFTASQLFDKFNNVITSLSPYTYLNQLGDLTSTNVITVNPRPKATVLGTNTVCNGSPITFAVLLKGQAPWTVQLSDGSQLVVPAGNITNNGCLGWAAVTNVTRIPTNLFDNCAVTTNYFVLSVTDSSGCPGGQPGDITGSAKVTINPRPKASVLGTNTVCNGQSFTFTINLQGQAPWTVQLSDGSQLVVPAGNITNNSCLGWAAVTNVTRIPTNLLDNCGVTTNYFVLSVTDASGCSGNLPGDIAGTAQVTVNPRPKTSVTGTNTVCNGQPFTFTINLKGQAPWTLQLSDGSQLVVPVGNVTNPGCLGWAAFTNVTRIPTNIFLNTSSVTNYFVVSVTDASTCSGNTTGDTIGTAKVTVNPRPTATLVSTNLLNYLFSANICNYGTNYTITNILTGVGVWTVTWNDGLVQSANTTAGNSATLLRTVAPTNGFGANTFSNNLYYITSIVDTNSCLGNQPGDIRGTNTMVVNPRPTATLISTNLANYNFAATGCNYGTSYTITNILTGVGPWTVGWFSNGVVVPPQSVGSPGGGPFTYTVKVYPANSFGANTPSNNIYYITSVQDANSCFGNEPGDIRGTNTMVVNPRPTATLISTNLANFNFAVTDCNYATNYTITNILTGLGVWTVTWNDGFVQYTNAAAGNSATLLRKVNPTNSLGANAPSNNVYYITSVVDTNSCIGNQPGDIRGTNTMTINPRPTATLTSTNQANYKFAVTNCNYGTNYTIMNILTGVGVWTVQWNDGFVQYATAVPGSSAILLRTVNPTNYFGANTSSNNVYYITNIVDTNSCFVNLPGDVLGTNAITVNPRPTATLLSTNLANYKFAVTNCNYGTNYTITNILTGMGVWTVTWNDGYIQSAMAPPGNPATLLRTVAPTNSPGASAFSNNVYYITSVVDTNLCFNNEPMDIRGTNLITIIPTPTATLSMNTNDIYSVKIGSTNSSTGGGYTIVTAIPTQSYIKSISITQGTNFNAAAIFTYRQAKAIAPPVPPAVYLQTISKNPIAVYVTNHVVLTGVNPLTVIWSMVSMDSTNGSAHQYFATNIVSSGLSATHVWTNNIFSGTPGTNFAFSLWSVTDGFACMNPTNNLTNSYTLTFNGRPSADVYVIGDNPICSGGMALIQVDLGGTAPWTNKWSDGTTSIVTNSADLPLIRTNVLTDYSPLVATNYSYWITNLSDANFNTSDTTNDLTGIAVITVDPVWTNAPISLGNVTNCTDVVVPLSVRVPVGFTADWYTNSIQPLYLVATSITNFVPPLSVNPATNIYYVVARFDDPGLTNACVSPWTNVTQVSLVCTNGPQISSILPVGNNVVIQWTGDYILLHTTNLVPAYWMQVTQGAFGTNKLPIPVSPPPANDFFRLWAPTNWPYTNWP